MKSKLQEFLEIERTHGFYDEKICGVSIWHYYRYYYRYKYVSAKTGAAHNTSKLPLHLKVRRSVLNVVHSFSSLTKLVASGRQIQNLFFAFPRLLCRDGVYFDKFTDPVIPSLYPEGTRIFQFSFSSTYVGKRRNEELVSNIECLYVLSALLSPFYALWRLFSFDFIKINRLFKKVKKDMPLNWKDYLFFHTFYLRSKMMQKLLKIVFRRLKVERLFGVERKVFENAIFAAHQLGIPVYEFQHGVTFGDTALYSGPNCPELDPDYFLSFGEIWNGPQFGISPDNIINVGWAYKDEVIGLIGNEVKKDAVLIISSPEITRELLQTTEELAKMYPKYHFDIRCHPMEKYSAEQQAVVDGYPNISMSDKSVDSNIAVGQYDYVLGTNSTVIYEALSLGKKVGRICFNGMNSRALKPGAEDGFFYLHQAEDFALFVESSQKEIKNLAYSDFMPEKMKQLKRKTYQ
jgi:hypothetical protein